MVYEWSTTRVWDHRQCWLNRTSETFCKALRFPKRFKFRILPLSSSFSSETHLLIGRAVVMGVLRNLDEPCPGYQHRRPLELIQVDFAQSPLVLSFCLSHSTHFPKPLRFSLMRTIRRMMAWVMIYKPSFSCTTIFLTQ